MQKNSVSNDSTQRKAAKPSHWRRQWPEDMYVHCWFISTYAFSSRLFLRLSSLCVFGRCAGKRLYRVPNWKLKYSNKLIENMLVNLFNLKVKGEKEKWGRDVKVMLMHPEAMSQWFNQNHIRPHVNPYFIYCGCLMWVHELLWCVKCG